MENKLLLIHKVTKENVQCLEKKTVFAAWQKHRLVWASQKRNYS